MNKKILFVDDDRHLLTSWERSLGRHFELETADSGEGALARLPQRGPYAVVVADRQMPGMDGIQLLSAFRQRNPDTVRMMLTGNADLETTIRVVNEGNIFRFLTKPCPQDLLSTALRDALAQHQLINAEKELLNKTLGGSIKLLTDILSAVDPQSFGRAQLLRDTVASIADKLKLENAWELHLAIMLAPLGYITVPPATLLKARAGGPLTEAETRMLTAIHETAARLLANIPRLEGVARIVRYQQKDFNGAGYPPDTTSGDAIPEGARLLRILLDMIQLQSKGCSQAQALSQMREREGAYDPGLLAAVRAGLAGAGRPALAAPRESIAVAPGNLAPGMVLRSNVKTKDGMLVLSAGHQLTCLTLEKLRNFDLLAGLAEPILVEAPENPPACE